ncbi:Methyltransferase-like protein 4 [Tyrophagus putrescentiae]|nr:Methyltransferase-like protein 4 [Tyrophagus putrescentiae]
MASSNFSSSTSVEMIEQDNLVGLYVTHNQQLDLHSVQMEGGLKRGTYIQPMPASPTKRTTAAAAAKTNGSSRINGHQQNQQQHFRRFELNAKLFAINEPYLMKTERESLMQQLLTDQAAAATATEEVAQLAAKAKAKTNGTAGWNSNSNGSSRDSHQNGGKSNPEAEEGADEEALSPPVAVTTIGFISIDDDDDGFGFDDDDNDNHDTASPSKAAGRQTAKIASSPAKRKQQQGQSSSASANANSITTTSSANNTTSSTNSTIINKDNPPTLPPTSSAASAAAAATTAEQLLRASLATGDSNQEAQSFVGGLFRNRFESLNYRGKVFCNPFGRVIRAKIGLSSYLIPARCSFAGADICEGLQALKKEITERRVTLAGCSSSTSSTSTSSLSSSSSSSSTSSSSSFYEPFYVLLDPAWDNNKSVKRKKSYETVSLDYLRRMCRDLKELIDEVLLLKREQQQQPPPKKNGVDKKKVEGDGDNSKQKSSSLPPPPVVVAVWTTKADKDFVLSEMLPLMQATAAYELKWHKVTIAGCPVKVHGGLEYLLVAERWWTGGGGDITTTTNGTTTSSPSSSPPALRSGLLVSVPSAVHSHKPTPVPVLRKLYGLLDHHHPHHHHPHLPSSSTLLRSNSTSSSSSSSSTSTSTSASSRTSPENSTGDHQRGRSASTSAASSASSSAPAAVVEQFSYGLAESEVISPLVGVELFARYLQSGFHSIGYECIKLQNEELFTSRIVQ